MGTGRIRAGLLASLIAMGVAAHAADGPSKGFASALLAEHNSERDRAGVPRLVWSGKLAHEAHQWAEVLARENTMRHAPRDISRGAGENLWMGAAGYYGPDKMVGAFVDEKRVFVHGTFPKVSTTGRWQDVGHYTQVVWRDTKEVGCAIARGEAYDFLVCRYWPAGNWIGQVPF